MSLYWGASHTIRALSRALWRARATGVENIPTSGPLILACNHMSYLDPPVMGSFVPRQIHFMAKKELFAIPIFGAAIRAVGAYPVDRQAGGTAAIKRSLEVLHAGGCIGIFPEGTRNLRGSIEARRGVALLASLAHAPVVPACIVGSENAARFAPINVAFAPPLRLPEGRKATRDDLAKFTEEVMSAITALVERVGGNSKS